VDEEQKLDGGAERLSASAFLARYESFRYIETRSGMKMSDKRPPFASGLPRSSFAKDTREQDSKLAPLQGLSNRELELLEPSLTHRKQTTAPRSNRELSTNQVFRQFSFVRCAFVERFAPQNTISNRFCPTFKNGCNVHKTNGRALSNRF
jgi:hypothetical protein